MRFVVPQFIEYETKIMGPFTFNQFLLVAGAVGLCLLLRLILPFSIFIIASIIIMGAALGVTLVKINGRPLTTVLGSALRFSLGPKIYIWKKKEVPITQESQLKKLKTKTETKKEEK